MHFVGGRINGEKFLDIISDLSETHLLDLLTEEIVGTDYEEIINAIINNSFFKSQIDNRNLDTTPIRQSFKSIFTSFEVTVTIAEIQEYKKTGLSFKFGIEYKDIPESIRSTPSYLKFGQNNNTSCLTMSLGIKSRELARLLYTKSGGLTGKEFILWMSNLTNNEIIDYEANSFDADNINEIASHLCPYSGSISDSDYTFELQGTKYNPEWWDTSTQVTINTILSYKRDEYNKYDPFAIMILYAEKPIGFVPRNYAKILSTEIDIEEKSYVVTVAKIVPLAKY